MARRAEGGPGMGMGEGARLPRADRTRRAGIRPRQAGRGDGAEDDAGLDRMERSQRTSKEREKRDVLYLGSGRKRGPSSARYPRNHGTVPWAEGPVPGAGVGDGIETLGRHVSTRRNDDAHQ